MYSNLLLINFYGKSFNVSKLSDAGIDMDVISFNEDINKLVFALGDQIHFNNYLKLFVQDKGIRESPFYIHHCDSADTVILEPCFPEIALAYSLLFLER